MKLQYKLALLMFAFGITFLLAISVFYHFYSRGAILETARHSLRASAEEIANNIEIVLGEKANIASVAKVFGKTMQGCEAGETGNLSLVQAGGEVIIEKEHASPREAKAPDRLIEAMRAHTAGTDLIRGENGTEKVFAYAPVRIVMSTDEHSVRYLKSSETGWFIVVSKELREVLEPAVRATRRIIFVGVILTALMAITALFPGKRISRQIIRFAEHAAKIGQGDFPSQINISASGELKALADALDKMVLNLSRTTTSRDLLLKEIKQHTLVEKRLNALNRTLTVLSGCEQTMLHASEEQELLQDICRLIVNTGGYQLAWVGAAEQKGTQWRVRPLAQAGYEEGYLESLNITWTSTEQDCGPICSAILSGKPCVNQDILNNPDFVLWHYAALKRGYRSALVIPLRSTRPLEVLSIYASQTDAFQPGEVDLLVNLADNLAYGMAALHTRKVHKRTEEKLRNTYEELESRVESRTRALMEEIAVRKQAEEKLRASEDKLRIITSTANDAIVMMDDNGKTTFWNKAAERIFGYSNEEILGKGLHLFIAPEKFHESFRKNFQQFRESGAGPILGKTVELFGLKKDGDELPVEISVAAVNVKGKWHAVGVIRDITERARVKQALALAKEAAETANRAKSEFIANMSHEIRTPLNGILGFAQILKRDKALNKQQQSAVQTIQQSGEHLLMLINDILDLSKIEAGKMELRAKSFQLLVTLKNIVEMLRLRARQKNLDFNYEIQDDLPPAVTGDEIRLRQVLFNLLGNALKFTRQGGVTFKVYREESCVQKKKCSGIHKKIRFWIEDSGPGIPAAQLQNIFLPFRQVGEARATTEGTGLGLAISKRFVEMMGGELRVESNPDRGSVFHFELALPEAPEWHAVTKSLERRITGIKGGARKILLADDKKANRDLLNALLSPLGFEVYTACNGKEAVAKALAIRPDAILMDLKMPEMSGIEAVRKIRQTFSSKDMAILAISASVFEQHRQEIKVAGCDDFIAKPVENKVLLGKLRLHLQLEWVYETEEADRKKEKQERVAPPIVAPTAEVVTMLYELASMGDVKAISRQAKLLEQTDCELAPFAVELQRLAKTFQVRQLKKFIEVFLAQEH
ncbi:MAG: PAS domain S-box protein [Gammaproteobacteria bacterium]|nr:PAS domain S-box protein [Gammaproteobacteria bacterium]